MQPMTDYQFKSIFEMFKTLIENDTPKEILIKMLEDIISGKQKKTTGGNR